MIKIGQIELPDFPLLLAPMEDVSDPPFRAVCKANGADLMYTEFISSEGLIRDAAKSRQKLDIFDYERPIGIQIFGSDIESMRESAVISAYLYQRSILFKNSRKFTFSKAQHHRKQNAAHRHGIRRFNLEINDFAPCFWLLWFWGYGNFISC